MTSSITSAAKGTLIIAVMLVAGPLYATNTTATVVSNINQVIDVVDEAVDKVENTYNTLNGKLQRIETHVERIDNALLGDRIRTITQRRCTRRQRDGRVVELNRTGVIGTAQRAVDVTRGVGPIISEFTTWGNAETRDHVPEIQR